MKSQKYHKLIFVMLSLSACIVLYGCGTVEKINETSSVTSDISPSEEPTEAITEAETELVPSEALEKETEEKVSPTDIPKERVAGEISKDIDNNGIMDTVQIIRRNDDSESFIRIYLNEEQIFEFKDPDCRIMYVEAFEYLDLDGDNINEIFIAADTDANCRTLIDVLCLKQTDGPWYQMDIPLNDLGNNGFPLKITRGKDEFDLIISSDDFEQKIQFNAAQYFVDDESDNIDTIQSYRKNNYKEGDEVDFSSGWGICEAKTGTYEGRNCIIASQGIEIPYGHGLGQINIYFTYNDQGKVEILNVEYLPD